METGGLLEREQLQNTVGRRGKKERVVRTTEAAQGRRAVSMRVLPVLTSVGASLLALPSPNRAQTAALAAAVALVLAAAVALAASVVLAAAVALAAAVVLLQRKASAEVLALALQALMALLLLELPRSFA